MSYRDELVCALLVGEYEESRLLMLDVFRQEGWQLIEARDRKRALEHLQTQSIHVVITSSEVAGWPWKTVLRNLNRMSNPPQLIVTSRTADDYLWAEVLNCGGYDVLPEPFRHDEVKRVVASARRHFYSPAARVAGHSQPSIA
jgi:DNA-binding response OmpR family regulator